MNSMLEAADVAELLKISLRKFEQLVVEGSIPPFVLIGRRRRWHSGQIAVWIDSQFRDSSQRFPLGDEQGFQRETSLVGTLSTHVLVKEVK